MKNITKILNTLEITQKFSIFIFLTFSIYQVTTFFTELPSILNKFNEFNNIDLMDLKDYEEPIISKEEINLKMDSGKEEENKILLTPEDKSGIELNTSNGLKLSTIVKLAGLIIGTGVIVFGIWYGISKLGSQVDVIADVAQKGLDESNQATKEVTQITFDVLEKSEQQLVEKHTSLIKEIPKIKPKNFYQPPHRD